MSQPPETDEKPSGKSAEKLLQSGIIFSAVSFLANLGNFAFQAIIGWQLGQSGEFSLANNALIFAGFLALPVSIASTAVTHYIARFHFSGDDARLVGLLAGCRRFLFWLTIGGSVFAVVLVKPLSDFFHFPRAGLMIAALAVVLTWLWSVFATTLCQGLGWFKRLAFITFAAMIFRLVFCACALWKFPVAESAVLASVASVLPNLILLAWRKDLARRAQPVSPWNREFVQFLILSAACVGGNALFLQGDTMVAQRHFGGADCDAYLAAERLAVALPLAVAPLLTVLFTHRSGEHHGDAMREQLKLLGLYAAGLFSGAVCLFVLRTFCLKLLRHNNYNPASADMIGWLAVTMIFVGLLQSLALWSLASRWMKISLLYGVLGLAYWLTLFFAGKSPNELLHVMPIASGIAFAVLFLVWLIAMRLHKIGAPEQS
jgi:hypothetical protein